MRREQTMKSTSSTRIILCAIALGICSGQAVADDLDQIANGMIQLITEMQKNNKRDGKIMRFNQGKSLGCFNADFEVPSDLPAELQQGLFAQPGRYQARLRFASASTFDDQEKDLRGMSIKVLGVPGSSLAGEDGEQDFLLNSYPALFVDTPETFYKFIQASYRDERIKFFINPLDSHLDSLWILFKARDHHSSPFDIRYWSTTPFAFGTERAVKYSTRPCSTVSSDLPGTLSENYLRDNMEQHLASAPACFDFMVQFQTNDDDMPLEDASVIWDEDDSPFQTVARINIEPQDFQSPGAMAECENISFNPWQSLPQHKPLGRMNQVRYKVYSIVSGYRRGANGNGAME
jgi:catalase